MSRKQQEFFEHKEVVDMLCEVLLTNSQAEVGRMIGVSRQYVADMLGGRKPLSGKLLDFIGLERVVVYRPSLTGKAKEELMREPV